MKPDQLNNKNAYFEIKSNIFDKMRAEDFINRVHDFR